MHGITYDWDDDHLVKEGLTCPDCGENHTYFDYYFRFWHCEDCSYVWSVENCESNPPGLSPSPKNLDS